MALARSFVKIFIGALLALAVFGPRAEAQSSGWKLCNYTSYILEAATGRPEGQGITVDGWQKLQPGACKTVLSAPLNPQYHYVYARTSSAHRGGRREWGGKSLLCTDPSASFSIENPPDCSSMGLEGRKFKPVAITRSDSWTTRFTEVDNFSPEGARAAGVQRLLEEAGIVTGSRDGNIGARTRAAISQFLKDNGLPATTSDADLIDFLEQVAQDKGRAVGFTLCNRSPYRIWSAIARRGLEGWESRGWWLIEAESCARVVDKPLRTAEHYVYAELEQDGAIRTLTRANTPFCIGRAKFAIIGRDQCEASAYRSALFAPAPAPTDRKLLYEFFERDFGKAAKPSK